LYSSCIKVLVDATVHSEDGKVIKCDFKPGSVERSTDLYQREVYLSKVQAVAAAGSSRRYFQSPPPIKIERFSSGHTIFQI
jgi:hypothetical protein